MKSVSYIPLLYLILIALGECHGESDVKRDPNEASSCYCTTRTIMGTILKTQEQITYQEKSKWSIHSCEIGYEREAVNGTTFLPVLILPSLVNDRYEVKFIDGRLVVTKFRTHEQVVTLNLDGIIPNAVREPIVKNGKDTIEADPDKDIGYGAMVLREIEGTTLSIIQTVPSKNIPARIENTCAIGYKRESENRATFISILSLPILPKGQYVASFLKGSIYVTMGSSGLNVVEVNLVNLAPSTITHD